MKKLFSELRRRRVPATVAAYSVTALAVAEATNLAADAAFLPSWTVRFVVIAAICGLPMAVALAWAFDVVAAASPPPSDEAQAEAIAGLRRRMIESLDPTQLTRLRQEAEILVNAYPTNLEARSLLLQLHEAEISAGVGEAVLGSTAFVRRVDRAAWVRRHAIQLMIAPLLLAGVGVASLTFGRPTPSPNPMASAPIASPMNPRFVYRDELTFLQVGTVGTYQAIQQVRPQWLETRDSVDLAVYVDGALQGGLDDLRWVRASDVAQIEFNGGALRVTTRADSILELIDANRR